MINTPLVTVAGNYNVTDDVIFCDLLQFAGPSAQLVICPMPGAQVGARRLLKIVANVIDTTGSTGATITYNMDNNFELPAGNIPSFADPTTQAKTGATGSPSSLQIPLVDIASPDWLPIPPGPFPKAADGGDGYDGGRGGTGAQGMDGPTVEIWTTNLIGSLTIDLRGQQGGNGGNGGNGQFGGTGQAGSQAVTGTDTTWLGVPNAICAQPPGLPGDGGRGGNAGCGGDGGDGGNGGFVKILHTSAVNVAGFTTMVQGGNGGSPGNPGKPGQGGAAGPLAINIPLECGTTQNAQPGPEGDPCGGDQTRGGMIAQAGPAGANGTVTTYLVTAIPQD